MLVVVESTLSGSVSGYLNCSVTGCESADSLIAEYCARKGIPQNPQFVLKDHRGLTLDAKKTLLDCGIENGAVLLLEKQDAASVVFHFTDWRLVALGTLLVAAGGFATVVALHFIQGATPIQYGVVVDAGSSHTSLYVYQWDGPKWMGTGVLRQIGSCRIEGDVAALHANISAVEPFLRPCLTYGLNRVPSASRSATPIYLGATAGLRLLNLTEPNAAAVLLDGLRNALHPSGFAFQRDQVEMLTGSQEARFTWIAVNAQFNTLATDSSETVGALDLGGASTQMAMELDADGGTWSDAAPALHLYGRNHTVYGQSSLCYGILQVVRRYHAQLIRDSGWNTSVVTSPCHPSGYAQRLTFDQVFQAPCTAILSDSTDDGRSLTGLGEWTLNGSSDAEQCAGRLNRLFDSGECQSQFLAGTCFNGGGQPAPNGQNFVAVSSFYHTAADLNVSDGGSLADFRRAADRVCALEWHQVARLPLTVRNATLAPLLCTESQYVLSLLTLGYGFDDLSWSNLTFLDKVTDTDMGWSLGYMTQRTNGMEARLARPLLLLPAFAALTVLFGLFLLVGVLLSHHAYWLHRSSQSYSRLPRPHSYGSLTVSL